MKLINKEVYKKNHFNVAALNAGTTLAIEDQEEARHNDLLPHNSFILTNLDATCTLFLFLDDFSDPDKPDYVVFPKQQIVVGIDDGVSFTTLWIKNVDLAANIAAKQIKTRISTIRRME